MADQLYLFVAAKSPARPMVYAYEDKHYPGKLKVGYTAVDVDMAAWEIPQKEYEDINTLKMIDPEAFFYWYHALI